MVREHLQRAAETLEEAAESADGEIGDRLENQAEQLSTLATADRGPDHGRLARHTNKLQEIGDDADEEVQSAVEEALDHVTEYRKTVEGV